MFAGITKSNLARFVVIIVATVLLITACSQSEKVTERGIDPWRCVNRYKRNNS
jgi:hypothetical protein